MKPIGNLEGGGKLVELTGHEWQAFCQLHAAVTGETTPGFVDASDRLVAFHWDMTSAFGAIKAFCRGQVEVNRLAELVKRLQDHFAAKEPEPDMELAMRKPGRVPEPIHTHWGMPR